MPSVIRIQYAVPSAVYLDRLLKDDLILRYVKDAYEVSRHCTEFYDTEDWALTRSGFSLDVIRDQAVPVVHLCRGRLLPERLPGLFHGEEWYAPFTSMEVAADALAERGAPAEFQALVGDERLHYTFAILHSSKATTLYLPDRTRIRMSFDSGELVAEGQHAPTYELSMTLLFGEEELMLTYCQQICERFELRPVEQSREQRARQLLQL